MSAVLEENRALLCYYTASGCRILRLFGSIYRIHPRGSRIHKNILDSWRWERYFVPKRP